MSGIFPNSSTKSFVKKFPDFSEEECQNPLMGVLDNFFPTGTITGIGTSVSSLKHVIKIITKKKKKKRLFRRIGVSTFSQFFAGIF